MAEPRWGEWRVQWYPWAGMRGYGWAVCDNPLEVFGTRILGHFQTEGRAEQFLAAYKKYLASRKPPRPRDFDGLVHVEWETKGDYESLIARSALTAEDSEVPKQ